MHCKNCGQKIDEEMIYCPYCGVNTTIDNSANISDAPSVGFGLLGFFIPLVGLILYLVYEGKQPKRAKSAGKGALIGFILKIVISAICVALCITGVIAYVGNISEDIDSSIYAEESNEDILEKYADITFGEFQIVSNGYFDETSLDVTVKNIADKRYTFSITIEAVDADGARLETDTIYADSLNAGQSISLTAFEYIEDDKVDKLKNASFKVLDIQCYNY